MINEHILPDVVDPPDVEADDIRAKLLHVLRVYHVLNPTMVQAGLGNMVPPTKWRPVLERLIAEGTVRRVEQTIESHKHQMRTYARIFLADQSNVVGIPND